MDKNLDQTPVFNVVVEKGITKQIRLVYKDSLGAPINVSGYTGTLKVRGIGTGGRTISETPVAFETTSGGISFPFDSANYQFAEGEFVVDITPPLGQKIRLLKGLIQVVTGWA